jgi:hypothetical protein
MTLKWHYTNMFENFDSFFDRLTWFLARLTMITPRYLIRTYLIGSLAT